MEYWPTNFLSQRQKKLIEHLKNIVLTQLGPVEGKGVLLDEGGCRLDLAIRWHTTAQRDFYRAFREYREAKNFGSSSAMSILLGPI